jgi:hypothetical protein
MNFYKMYTPYKTETNVENQWKIPYFPATCSKLKKQNVEWCLHFGSTKAEDSQHIDKAYKALL